MVRQRPDKTSAPRQLFHILCFLFRLCHSTTCGHFRTQICRLPDLSRVPFLFERGGEQVNEDQ